MKRILLFAVLSLFFTQCYAPSTPPLEEASWGKTPKNIILMIGDGMGLSQISATSIEHGELLAIEKFTNIGLVKTNSTKLITDSAAGATAMVTGQKTYNGAIAMSTKQDTLKTILEYARDANWRTGIVTTATVTHATPAAFYAHQPSRSRVNRKIAAQFIETDMKVLMGGGWNYFKDGLDGRDHIQEAQEKGYFVNNSIDIGEYLPQKMLCLISPKLPPKVEKRGPFLPMATAKSIEILNQYPESFLLVVEGRQIDWGGHENKADYIIQETLDFDAAVQNALDFAIKDEHTLVIVTADHETGGFAINKSKNKEQEVEYDFTTDYHTATMVPIFAYGPSSEIFRGVMDNTEIFYKIKSLSKLDQK